MALGASILGGSVWGGGPEAKWLMEDFVREDAGCDAGMMSLVEEGLGDVFRHEIGFCLRGKALESRATLGHENE